MDYSALFKSRQAGFRVFGTIYQLPIVSSAYDFLRRSYHGGRVLDVGAGVDKTLKTALGLPDEAYAALDNDPAGDFDYRSPADIPPDAKFDWIVLNQLVEHLTVAQNFALLEGLRPHLSPAGKLVITTPNIFHPNRFWGDPTHVTPWGHLALYGLVQNCGYEVQAIYRYSKNRRPLDPLTWLVERLMRRLYRIDWCDSILLVAVCAGSP